MKRKLTPEIVIPEDIGEVSRGGNSERLVDDDDDDDEDHDDDDFEDAHRR